MNIPFFPLIHQYVEYHARVNAQHIAIEEKERSLDYAGLADSLDKIAAALQSLGASRHDRVAFLIDNGIEATQALLGILRADCCFVALNPVYPPERVAAIINDSEAKVVITTKRYLGQLQESLGHFRHDTPKSLLVLDIESKEISSLLPTAQKAFREVCGQDFITKTGSPKPNQNTSEDLAYILFTSGTTGTPKGVMISHRAISSTIRWGVEYFNITYEDRLSNHSRLSFDVSLFDIFAAFMAGATLCPLTSQGECAFPGSFIRKMGITLWFSVPSVIDMMIKSRQLAAGKFPALRAALFAGEPLAGSLVEAWFAQQAGIPVYNLYGPTEAAIVCTVHNVGVDTPFEPGKPMPIGLETRDSELMVLDLDKDEIASPNQVGRLMICGAQLANGYWRRPDLTAKAFRLNPFKADFGAKMYDTGDLAYKDEAGVIYFLGRADSQIKIMGYRVELGEIEASLAGFAGVREAAAVYIKGDNPQIIGVVSLQDGVVFDMEAILEHCGRTMPVYMLPKRVIKLDVMPRNLNGKIDRKVILDMLEKA